MCHSFFVLHLYCKSIIDEFGEPTSESTSYGDNLVYRWETDEYRIMYEYYEPLFETFKTDEYIRYLDVSDEDD